MKNRGAVILNEEGKLALIKRVRDGSVYYVFPGGGIEQGETPEAAAKREAFEETGVEVEIDGLFATVENEGSQYFYLARRIGGMFGAGFGDEFTDSNRNRGSYLPLWVEIVGLDTINVKRKEVAIDIQRRF